MHKLSKTYWGSVALALALWFLDLPLLAIAPQSGDAAEQLIKASLGGILHPPGFPLQAWLNRLFVLLPFHFPTTGLALLGSVGHALAAFFIAESLRHLEARAWARVVGVAAFAFFPSVWFNSVRPEVFALSNCLLAWMIYLLVVWRAKPLVACPWTWAVTLGVTVALAGAQHTLNVVALPVFVLCAFTLAAPRATRLPTLVLGLGSFVAVFVALYASLPAMAGGGVLDWAPLDSAAAIARHALRVDYGIFTLGSGEEPMTANGLGVFAHDSLRAWAFFVGFVFLGGWVLWRRGDRPLFCALLGMGGLSLTLLWRSLTFGREGVAEAIVSRFQGPAVIVAAIAMGLGFSQLQNEWPDAGRRRLMAGAAALFCFLSMAHYWGYVNAGSVYTLELFRGAIAESLPKDAVYLSAADTEAFYGVPTPDGIRFPIENGALARPAYAKNLPLIDPRFEVAGPITSAQPLVASAYERGLTVASVEVRLLWNGGHTPELRGLLFALNKNTKATFGSATVDAALALCPYIDRLRTLPAIVDPVELNFYAHFARAYNGAAQYLAQTGKQELAALAAQISEELKQGRDWLAWTSGCRRLTAALKPKEPPQTSPNS